MLVMMAIRRTILWVHTVGYLILISHWVDKYYHVNYHTIPSTNAVLSLQGTSCEAMSLGNSCCTSQGPVGCRVGQYQIDMLIRIRRLGTEGPDHNHTYRPPSYGYLTSRPMTRPTSPICPSPASICTVHTVHARYNAVIYRPRRVCMCEAAQTWHWPLRHAMPIPYARPASFAICIPCIDAVCVCCTGTWLDVSEISLRLWSHSSDVKTPAYHNGLVSAPNHQFA